MPIGKSEGKVMTKEELDDIWQKYRKLDKKKKRKKLFRSVRART
jgi:preprotein translocase subunit Sec63